ncbi:MAG: DUF6512 family protein [Promethearchaeota archaeon]
MSTETRIEDNKKKILIWQIVGAFVIFGVGALWHFIFEWIGDPEWLGWFLPVNESVWEHVKLMYWPAILYFIVEGIFLWKKTNNFLFTKMVVLFFNPIVNIIIFYTYSGITGYENFIIDSIILFITTCVQQYISYRLLTREEIWADKRVLRMILSIFGILVLGALLALWTYLPPHIPLFMDNNFMAYGILPHSH